MKTNKKIKGSTIFVTFFAVYLITLSIMFIPNIFSMLFIIFGVLCICIFFGGYLYCNDEEDDKN